MSPTLLRIPDVKARTGMSRSTIYLRISQGLWPKPVALGPRMIAWPANEIDSLNAARIAGKGDEEIHELVLQLEAARRAAI